MSNDTRQNRPPLVLTRLWKRAFAKGNSYIAGRLGNACVLVMAHKDKQWPDDLLLAEAGEHEGNR